MVQEQSCLICDRMFPSNSMVRGIKTNSYGDKIQKGFLCSSCYRKRVEKRSLILLGAAIVFVLMSVGLLLIIPLFFLVTQLYDEQNFKFIIETFLFWGVLMALFGIFMFLIRRKELKRMEKTLLKRY